MRRPSRRSLNALAAGLPLLATLAGGLQAEDATEKGRDLAQRVYDRPDGDDRTMRATMVLTEEGHPPRVRQLFMYELDKGPGDRRSLVRFTSPSDIANVGLLTVDRPGERSDQWLYLPELGTARRVAAAQRGGRFVGSDFYYEDLEDREVALDVHRHLGSAELDGVECEMLESVPVDPRNSVYSKRLAWIHPDTLVPLRVDLFRRGREEPSKRFQVHRLERIQGFWTVMDSTMTDLASGHETRIVLEAMHYDRGLPEDLFSRHSLEDPAREARHRPD